MKLAKKDLCKVVGGLVLLGAGFVLLRLITGMQGNPLPYLCIGLGCGLFGHGMGNLLSARALRGSPELARQLAIETADERNVAIRNRAKAKAFDIMLFVFGALMLSFALMQVELAAILLLVGAYLVVTGSQVYYLSKYQKEM